MKSRFASIAFAAFQSVLAATDLDVARQALNDGVWQSALSSADIAATNAADRAAARLIALEALSQLGDDAEIRRRLALWTDETDEHFRYWRARAMVRVRDFQQAKSVLEKPFADPSLAMPVTCLKAYMLAGEGDKAGALAMVSELKPEGKKGADAEDAQLIMGELLGETGKAAESRRLLLPLSERAGRREVRLRAGYLVGFLEMSDDSSRTAGVSRVRALLRSNPGDGISVAAARTFADKLLEFRDFKGADDEYRRYIEINPAAATDADVLDRRGRALLMLGRSSEAAGAFARAEQASANALEKAKAAYNQGEAFRAEGRYSDAAACFERSVGYGGADVDRARFWQADALERSGEPKKAEEIYSALGEQDGMWGAKARLRLAAIAVGKGRLSDAIDSYGKLVALTNILPASDITEAYLGRGRACYRDYRFKDAEADFGVVAKRDPQKADGMRFLSALCLYGAGKDIDAKAAAASLMTSTKDKDLHADLMLWCAKYEFNHGEYADACTHFETYASLRPGSDKAAEALLWAARCATALTDYSKAVELATQTAKASAADSRIFIEALLVQGEAVMELGRYDEAVQVFDRAAKQAGSGPDATKAAVLKADALYAMGAGDLSKYNDAIEAYRSLPDGNVLSPDRRIEVAFKIGRALEKVSRTADAMDQYYKNVLLAYSEATGKGVLLGTPARTFFARAAFSLADYFVAAGNGAAARSALERVIAADVPAAGEAKRRLAALKEKGGVR